MVIHGDKSSLWADIVFNQEGKCCFEIRFDDQTKQYEFDVKSNYALEVEQLSRCITDGEKPHVSKDFSLMVSRVIDRVLNTINY